MSRPLAQRRSSRLAAVVVVAVAAVLPAGAPVPATAWAATWAAASSDELSERGWIWPVSPFRVVEPYVQPAHRYAPGHRGIDLEPASGAPIVSPADGVIAFAGTVAGRPIVAIDHGDGLVTTLEPVSSALVPGTAVRRGETVGELALGGHVAPGVLHFGVRLAGEYINPLLLLGGIPRAVLLPCCGPLDER